MCAYVCQYVCVCVCVCLSVCVRVCLSVCLYVSVAIYHNDCMYVAHHLMLLGHQFQPHLCPPLGSVTFIDLVPVLRRSGTRCFTEQLSLQQTQLTQSLNTAHGMSLSLPAVSPSVCLSVCLSLYRLSLRLSVCLSVYWNSRGCVKTCVYFVCFCFILHSCCIIVSTVGWT